MWCWCGCQMVFLPYLVGFQWWCACVFWFPNDFLQEPHNIPTWLPIKHYQNTAITQSKHQHPKNGSVPPNMAVTKTNWFPFNTIKIPPKSQKWVSATKHGCKLKPLDFHSTPPKPHQNPKNGLMKSQTPNNSQVTPLKANQDPIKTTPKPHQNPTNGESLPGLSKHKLWKLKWGNRMLPFFTSIVNYGVCVFLVICHLRSKKICLFLILQSWNE